MQHHVPAWPIALASLCTLSPLALAQSLDTPRLDTPPLDISRLDAGRLDTLASMDSGALRNRFRLSYRMAFGISAEFKNLGGFNRSNPGPATGGAVNRTYDNGFNRVDSTGNAPLPGTTEPVTTFWGYDSASQVVDDTIVMSSSSAAANLSTGDKENDPHQGFELIYSRAFSQTESLSWGLEAAVGMTFVSISDNQSLSGPAQRISDVYPTFGIIPPAAPFSGTFTGPGPMIGSTPSRTVAIIPDGETVTGKRSIDANVYGLRLGPYLEVPLLRRLSAGVSAGLALAMVNSEFKFNEKVTVPGATPSLTSGKDSSTDVLFGGYVGVNASYALTQSVSLFTGFQYQHLGKFNQKAGGKEASLDLGGAMFWSLGLGYSF